MERSKAIEAKVNQMKNVTSRLLLSASILGAGFLLSVETAHSQSSDTEVKPPLPSLFNPNPFGYNRLKSVFAMRPPVDLRFYDGCEVTANSWEGRATHYYPGDGCQGCSENNLTASGVPLNYRDRTLAFMDAPIGTWVKIGNLLNGMTTRALINDTGDFKRHGYIADLAPATLKAIQGTDITEVKITALKNCA